MLTMAMPPRIQPTQASASAISFSEMPPEPMSTPMVMKNGTAIRLKEEIPLTIRRQTSVSACPCTSIHSTLDRPTAYAMGKRRKIITKKLTRRTMIASV